MTGSGRCRASLLIGLVTMALLASATSATANEPRTTGSDPDLDTYGSLIGVSPRGPVVISGEGQVLTARFLDDSDRVSATETLPLPPSCLLDRLVPVSAGLVATGPCLDPAGGDRPTTVGVVGVLIDDDPVEAGDVIVRRAPAGAALGVTGAYTGTSGTVLLTLVERSDGTVATETTRFGSDQTQQVSGTVLVPASPAGDRTWVLAGRDQPWRLLGVTGTPELPLGLDPVAACGSDRWLVAEPLGFSAASIGAETDQQRESARRPTVQGADDRPTVRGAGDRPTVRGATSPRPTVRGASDTPRALVWGADDERRPVAWGALDPHDPRPVAWGADGGEIELTLWTLERGELSRLNSFGARGDELVTGCTTAGDTTWTLATTFADDRAHEVTLDAFGPTGRSTLRLPVEGLGSGDLVMADDVAHDGDRLLVSVTVLRLDGRYEVLLVELPLDDADSLGDGYVVVTERALYTFDPQPKNSTEQAAPQVAAAEWGRAVTVVRSDGTVSTFLGPGPAGRVETDDTIVAVVPISDRSAWVVTDRGEVLPVGDAPEVEGLEQITLAAPIVDAVAAPGGGLWLAGADGGVFTLAGSTFHGSMAEVNLNGPVTGIAADPDGEGYWLFATDGGVFALDAPFLGSFAEVRLNAPIVDGASRDGRYVLVGADGGVFDVKPTGFLGSLVEQVAATESGRIIAVIRRPAD